MHTIIPYLWYDTQAAQAATFYASLFPDSAVLSVTPLPDTPSGNAEMVSARLWGQDFQMISAGPQFTFTPAISFMVCVDNAAEVDRIAATLGEGGSVLMPLDSYDFADRYVWLTDRWGLNWQLFWHHAMPPSQRIIPTLMFTGPVCGKAEEAATHYLATLGGTMGDIWRYGPGGTDKEGTVEHLEFTARGLTLAAMDSAMDHRTGFTEAISLMVRCEDQAEIDRLWAALSHIPDAEACGWCKDRWGLSWQIVPADMDAMLATATPDQMARFMPVMLSQKKFDIASLRAAIHGT